MAEYLLGNIDGVLERIKLRHAITLDEGTRDLTREVVDTVQTMSDDLRREGATDLATKLSEIVSMETERLGAATDFNPTPMDELSVPRWTSNLTGRLLDFVSDDMAWRPEANSRPFYEHEKQRFRDLHTRAKRQLDLVESKSSLAREVAELRTALGATQVESENTLKRLRETEERSKGVLQAAENAAGDIATRQFEVSFAELEVKEARIANWFRWATIVGISLAVAYAVLWAGGLWRTPGAGVADAARWVEFASHLTIVAGIGALTAYLGRQAGQHRKTANWAQSVAVQMRSFPALAGSASAASEGIQDALYVALANRVLAAPPEKGVEPDDTGVTSAQVMDIVLAAMKKTQTTT